MKNIITIPDVKGMNEEDAINLLNNHNIKHKVKKIFSFSVGEGKVVKTSPSIGTKIDNQEEVTIYIARSKTLLFLLILFLLSMFVAIVGLTYSFLATNDNINIISTASVPKIARKGENWVQNDLIYVTNDSDISNLSYYEYCAIKEDDISKCTWQETYTKNASLTESGIWYVWFRGVDTSKNRTKESNKVIAYVDSDLPIIEEIKNNSNDNSIILNVVATDLTTSVVKYEYSLDGATYVETTNEITINDLDLDKEYSIYIRVTDEAGNYTISNLKINMNDKNAIKKLVPPTSSFNELPSVIEYGDNYDLPSSIDFGSSNGKVQCTVDGIMYTNTKELTLGSHTIICTASNEDGLTTTAEKDIYVTYVHSDTDEELDGWIKLTLYYPTNSYNWQYTIRNSNKVSTYKDEWKDYTGPIWVKLSDVQYVYTKYVIDGKSEIVSINNKSLVIINPDSWALESGNTTTVNITYDKNATRKLYRLNNGAWQPYTGPFTVGPDTLIEAKVYTSQPIYNSDGEFLLNRTKAAGYISLFTPGSTSSGGNGGSNGGGNGGEPIGSAGNGPLGPGTYSTPPDSTNPSSILGPIRTANPDSDIVDATVITITTLEPAYKIYYKIGNKNYNEYNNPFIVTENTVITAYYIRDEDGLKSDISTYYVNNIREGKEPYVSINTNPSFLSDTIHSTTVTINAIDADTLEYSLDGINYNNYEKAFTVDYSTTVYAKAANEYGTKITSVTIVTENGPRPLNELSVKITANPSSIDKTVNKAKIHIDYDKAATGKFYKINNNGNVMNYTGDFELTEGATIYAWATNDTAYGKDTKMIDYVAGNIASPIITYNPTSAAQTVTVNIDYARNAVVTKYKIDNGQWQDYTGAFEVTENCVIYAYNSDVDGIEADSNVTISNIVDLPRYILIEKDDYFLIYLNYPASSPKSSWEYKWKESGTWTHYDSDYGIILVKPECRDKVLNSNGVMIIDDNGRTKLYEKHYYILDSLTENIGQNLFSRWGDQESTDGPEILVNTSDITNAVAVAVNYASNQVTKVYKTVSPTGVDSGWQEYNGNFSVTEANTIVYAKSLDKTGKWSSVTHLVITNIDSVTPVITIDGDLDKPVDELTITVNVTDDNEVELVAWDYGEKDPDYFEENGKYITNNKKLTITENGVYSFYAVDSVGNYTVRTVEITNIGNRPKIIADSTDWTTEKMITIKYHDGYVNQYSLDNGNTWTNYTEAFMLTENKTIVARSITSTGEYIDASSYTVSKIDNVEPELEISIKDEVKIDSDIALPTSTNNDSILSGSETVCKVGDKIITNTKELSLGEHDITCTMTTGVGKAKSVTKHIKVVRNLYSVEYLCTESVQEFVAPVFGKYKVEAYGAQGGSTANATGGLGGYVSGTLTLEEGEKYYIYVGCQGSLTKAGYNGGGSVNTNGASGGGATHIASVDLGLLANYRNNIDSILVVAGAGGGAGSGSGGAGGLNATSGLGIYGEPGEPGNQITGGKGGNNGGSGSFGQGGSINATYNTNYAGAGGSGFYGGGAGGFQSPLHSNEDGYGGAGGSSYISDKLNEVVEETGVQTGDGYVRITLVDQYYKLTPEFAVNITQLDMDTSQSDIIPNLIYTGDGDLTAISSNENVATVYINEDNQLVINPGEQAGEATITTDASKGVIYDASTLTFKVVNKLSPFFTLKEESVTTNQAIYSYEYQGPGVVTVTSTGSGGTVTHDSSNKKITVKASSLGELKVTIKVSGMLDYAEQTIVKRITFTDPTEVVSSDDTAFQSALTSWGTIGTATDANWYGTTSKTDTNIQNASNGDYVIVETVNTNNWTGYYYQYKDENGKWVVPQYKYMELDFDMTSTNSDDDVMGAMIRFNPQGFNSTTGANNNNFTGYVFLIDNHDTSGTGYGNGYQNGLWKSTGKQFSRACVGWTTSTSASNHGCTRLNTNRNYFWARRNWQHYKILADGSSIKVYRWAYNASGTYKIGANSKLLYSANDSSYATGTYGFWTDSQAYAQFKNLKVITRDIEGYRITLYDE